MQSLMSMESEYKARVKHYKPKMYTRGTGQWRIRTIKSGTTSKIPYSSGMFGSGVLGGFLLQIIKTIVVCLPILDWKDDTTYVRRNKV